MEAPSKGPQSAGGGAAVEAEAWGELQGDNEEGRLLAARAATLGLAGSAGGGAGMGRMYLPWLLPPV